MIHTKSLIRRLAYVPWMLAFGLMLGWAGEAQAVAITLEGTTSVREDAPATDIAVKAKVEADAAADIYVNLSLADDAKLNSRFRITLPTIIIPKGAKEGTATVTFTPISTGSVGTDYDPTVDLDLPITINGDAGDDHTIGSITITLIDVHKPSGAINLSFSPGDLSEEDGPRSVAVTATLDGRVQTRNITFQLLVDNTYTDDGDGDATTGIAKRDQDYAYTPTSLRISRGKVSGTATIIIDPSEKERGDLVSVSLRLAGDPVTFTDVDDDVSTTDIDETDNSVLGGGNHNENDESVAIAVTPGVFTVKDTPIAATKGLVVSPNIIREEAGQTEVALTVELATALPDDADVSFTIIDTGGDEELDNDPIAETDLEKFFNDTEAAARDVNYTAVVGDLTIPAGATKGTATLVLTPINNAGRNAAKGIRITAQVGAAASHTAGIKIVDDETPTTTITLAASPAEVKVGTGENEVTITGAIDGSVFEDDVTVILVLPPTVANGAGATTAQRDTDFTAVLRSLTIPAGEISGSTTVSVTALAGGDKVVEVKALKSPVQNDEGDDVAVVTVNITLKDADADAEAVDPDALAFGGDVDLSVTVFEYSAGEAIDDLELPGATGGEGDLTYSVSANLPAGLSFDADTQTISGTPTAVGEATVVYAVVDGAGDSAVMLINIEVGAAPPPTVAVASVTSTHSSLRESGETTSISITATLAEAAPNAGVVSFTIGTPGAGAMAIRDVDYVASLGGSVSIAAGATEATTTLVLTPIDNGVEDGNRVLGVHARASGGSASTDITIADDETASTSISLAASPHTVSEEAGVTEITITATLDGKVLDAAAVVTLAVDPGSQATRDVDYSALFNPLITIPAGSVSGSVGLLIDPTADSEDEDNETITLNGAIVGLADGTGIITISDVEPPPPPGMDLAFAEGTMINDTEGTAGEAISAVELPEASGGSGDIAYSVSDLPAGLSFDAATRTVSGTPSGTPEAEGTTEVTYTATDSEGATATMTFSIKVNAELEFDELNLADFFGMFNGAGKANPASEHDDGALQIVVGQPYSLTLPEVSGGTPPLTYSVSGLPAGLSFDPATRTVSGTPTDVSEAVAVTYTVTDGSGASSSLPFLVAVVEPALDAPDALVAEDYKGADGAGDQGGFVLLTWDLSADHESIDGYRIFRELPVLNNEMVPWAMVDAVPGVGVGRAIVATLDNVATNWGIAAERGGQTTHGAAKAVFVSGNQAYELMAETLMASREAAQAGDAPVFASLLPEALAYAQGVAPKLNLVEGVLESSAITMTEESVRAIDNIAPLAVPSISVLDAPNDQGSRIVLTWTLSPSDQLLQGVIAGTIGPTAVESVVGVHGYGIYRRAAGQDEFVLVGQVDAGVTSFVDETALNGVRYTYQVRPYDLDNEPVSDIEQTAMAVRNSVLDSEGRALFGLFGADNRIGFDDFFLFADNFGLTAEDAGFDPAFDLAPSAMIDFDDFFVFADNFGRSTAAAGKRVPMLAGLNADARMYLDARTAMPSVGEDFVLDVRVADFAAIKGYGLQVQYEADKLEFVEVLTDQPLGGSELATPQVLADQAGVLTVAAYGDIVSEGEVELSLVFRPKAEIENTVIEITDSQTYDSEFGFNRLALPVPVQLQTRPEMFGLANNYPNPFNPATTIKYALPQAADVELTVYNVVGQPVRTLVAEHQSAGRYVVEWDATNDSGHSLSSGMYFYRLQTGGEFREVKKMLLLK